MKKLVYGFLIFVIGCTAMSTSAYAESGRTSELKLQADSLTVRTGSNTTIRITASPYEELYGAELMVQFDPSVLAFSSQSGVDFSLFTSESSDASSGLLYVSAIAESSEGPTSGGNVANLQFRALKPAARTEVKLTAVKGVSRERITRERDGQLYPDLAEVQVRAGEAIAIQVVSDPGGASQGSGEGGLPPSQDEIRNEKDAFKAAARLTERMGRPDIQSDAAAWSKLVQETSERLLTVASANKEDGVVTAVLGAEAFRQAWQAHQSLQQAAKQAGLSVQGGYAVRWPLSETDASKLRLDSEVVPLLKELGLALEAGNRHFAVELQSSQVEQLPVGEEGYSELSVEPANLRTEQKGITRITPIAGYSFGFGGIQPSVQVEWQYPADSASHLVGLYRQDKQTGEWTYVSGQTREDADRVVSMTLDHDGVYALLRYERSFEDLTSTYGEAAKAIQTLAARGIVNGINDTHYGIGRAVTRSEWTALLVKAFGGGEMPQAGADNVSLFSDVDAGQWYSASISEAYRKGWIAGYRDGTFRPDGAITRAELAVLLDRLMQQQGEAVSPGEAEPYVDGMNIPEWAADAIHRMKALGLLVGDESGQFRPHDTVSREEAAVALLRIVEAQKAASRPKSNP